MRRHRTAETAAAGYDSGGGNTSRPRTRSPLNREALMPRSTDREMPPPHGPVILSFAWNYRRAAASPPKTAPAHPHTPPANRALPPTPPDSATISNPSAPARKSPASAATQAPRSTQEIPATAATPAPPHVAPAQPTLSRTLPPLRLPDASPAQLAALRGQDKPLCFRGIDPETIAAWEHRHNLCATHDRRNQLPFEYNARTGDFVVKCMPSAYHDTVFGFLFLTAAQELKAIFLRATPYNSLGITLCGGTNLTGFRLAGLALTCHKIPDFALRLSPHALFPALVAEVGFAKTWNDLVQDAALHLLAMGGVTRVVLVVKLWEAPCAGKRPWPAGVAIPRAGAAEAELHEKVFEIRSVLLDGVATVPLVGLLTAVVAVFVRAVDEANVGAVGRGGCVPEEPPQCNGIKCIYCHKFIEQDEPCDFDADDDGSASKKRPGIIAIPLRLLCPPQAAPDLMAKFLRAKPEMEAQRAVDAAIVRVTTGPNKGSERVTSRDEPTNRQANDPTDRHKLTTRPTDRRESATGVGDGSRRQGRRRRA
ncbi:hypothetical protein DFH27DRAFT_615668 [Peziza echinospora]|nr:hypothetical protein DFH27DRAFT_615668 [Peziza echinospora]